MRNTAGCATLSLTVRHKPLCSSPSRQAGRSSRRPGQDHLPGGASSRAAAPSRFGFGFGSDFRATVEIFFEKVLLFPGINFSFPKDGHKVMELTLAAIFFRVYVGGVSTTPKAMSLLQ